MTDSGPTAAAPLRAALTLIALLTAGIAAWLAVVVATVLPARDPAHVAMRTAFAIGFAVYSALTLLFVWRGPRPAALAVAVVVLSVGATAFGVYAAGSTVTSGRDFEGYRLVMGVVLAGHGLCALAYSALTRPIRTAPAS